MKKILFLLLCLCTAAIQADVYNVKDYGAKADGKTIDSEKLKNGKYKLGIVLSSSLDGAYFKGAVGSTLYVDELEIVCETNN